MGVFGATLAAFFVAEIGDKTQIVTAAMAARFDTFLPVVLGTTLETMLANVPAVLRGDPVANRFPVRLVHGIAAILGIAALLAPAGSLS